MRITSLSICLVLLSSLSLFGQDKVKIDIKEDPKPDVYIDGKKYDRAIFDLLDQDKIESVSIVKGEKALKEYDAPNGVVLIVTKKAARMANPEEKKDEAKDGDKEPMIIVDGKVASRKELSKISPNDIEAIEVLKGDKAMKQYNAPYGVVIVKTKNQK